ncbi:MAG: metallophosphoesterase family protein [Bacteroidota bacterium]
MRIAIISDVHANLEALTQAISIINRSNIDRIVCLGDIVGYGANPNECIEIIQRHCPETVLGNHDAAALDLSITRYFNEYAREAAEWTHDVLTQKSREYLESLPLIINDHELTFVHASPRRPAEWDYIFSNLEAKVNFPFFTTPICFIGHSHVPQIFSEHRSHGPIRRDDRYIINVGSIGQPRDGNPDLSFGIFDTKEWAYEHIRAPYNIDVAAKKIIQAGLPYVLAERLYEGT